ncbi:putative mitochondrial protein [Cucumis melo var. makuwa]|uniref:Mitochondrial protein n=1 Tax=Cucumis melo var. makuwa TaxID=1194695 RepID=A0A5A7UKQ0_CUCMM|nr:putative mitochondrial protein [Cucumis melo var. makuwa]TYK15013.1 putative mitochondrial protein [Cucumis melo var. makuwa]
MSPHPEFETQFNNQGYNQGHFDQTLFTKVSKAGKIAVLIVYVDDIVLSGDDTDEIVQLKKMEFEFEIKYLRNLKLFLEMEIDRSKEGISESQRKYTLDLLAETGMLGCRPADKLIKFNAKLKKSDNRVPNDKEKYKRLVGKFIYLSHTRLDISYVVSIDS